MTTYDQTEGVSYGKCLTCGLELDTRQSAETHMSETMEPDEHGNKRSHSTQATNPTREQRIRSLVDGIVQDAIEEALDNLQNEIARARISHDEVTAALGYYSDFADEWERAY